MRQLPLSYSDLPESILKLSVSAFACRGCVVWANSGLYIPIKFASALAFTCRAIDSQELFDDVFFWPSRLNNLCKHAWAIRAELYIIKALLSEYVKFGNQGVTGFVVSSHCNFYVAVIFPITVGFSVSAFLHSLFETPSDLRVGTWISSLRPSLGHHFWKHHQTIRDSISLSIKRCITKLWPSCFNNFRKDLDIYESALQYWKVVMWANSDHRVASIFVSSLPLYASALYMHGLRYNSQCVSQIR